MTELHQVVILTTHPVDQRTLQALMATLHRLRPDIPVGAEPWVGTVVKLQDTIEVPQDPFSGLPSISPHHIEPLIGKIAT